MEELSLSKQVQTNTNKIIKNTSNKKAASNPPKINLNQYLLFLKKSNAYNALEHNVYAVYTVCQDYDAVWRTVGQQGGPLVDYAEMMRAVTGEMSEIRKVYVKLDPNKTGYISLIDIEKFYSAKVNLHLEHGETLSGKFHSQCSYTKVVTKDVSYAEFEDYYQGLSIEISNDQEYINILKSTWGI
uniref:EF-hand domain-containing protein n=1 Tax=Pygocentrus nattereri TaxID=42514 RepID=A0AAR2KJZ2_PYGNA